MSFIHPSRRGWVPQETNGIPPPPHLFHPNPHNAPPHPHPPPPPLPPQTENSNSSPSTSPSPSSLPPSLFIRNLPLEMRQIDLNRLLSSYGVLVHSKILFSPNDRTLSRGIAFAKFSTHKESMNAMSDLDGKIVKFEEFAGGRPLFVRFARERGGEGEEGGDDDENAERQMGGQTSIDTVPEGRDPHNLYCVDLPLTVSRDSLSEIFGKFGKVLTATVLTDGKTQISRGVALIRFAEKDDAMNAMRALQGTVLPGALKPMRIRFARIPPSTASPSTGTSHGTVGNFPSAPIPIESLAALHRGPLTEFIDPLKIDFFAKFPKTKRALMEGNLREMRENEEKKRKKNSVKEENSHSTSPMSSSSSSPSLSPPPSSSSSVDFSSAWRAFIVNALQYDDVTLRRLTAQVGLPQDRETLNRILTQK